VGGEIKDRTIIMKYAIKEVVGEIGTLQDKSQDVTSNINENTKMLMVEHPLAEYPEDILVANSCAGLKTPMLSAPMKNALYKSMNFSKEKTVNVVYGFFNGKEFSDMLELWISNKLFNHEVGSPCIHGITGGGYKVTTDLELALPQFEALKNFLKTVHYRGEVSLGVSNTSMITDFYCGHNSPAFACYTEIHKTNTQKDAPVVTNILEFISGEKPACKLFPSLVLFNRVSVAPFPYILGDLAGKPIKVPDSAERHVWKVRAFRQETALVLSHADAVQVAQSRIRNSINNMKNYEGELQYRTDFGVGMKFTFSADAHKIAVEKSRFVQRTRTFAEHIPLPKKDMPEPSEPPENKTEKKEVLTLVESSSD